jgi:hypothetical protein
MDLLCFCASAAKPAGPSHWEALHDLMEYFKGFPGFKLTSQEHRDGLSGFLIPTGVTAVLVPKRMAMFVYTTAHWFFGARRCRRPQYYQWQRLNTIRAIIRLDTESTAATEVLYLCNLGFCATRAQCHTQPTPA